MATTDSNLDDRQCLTLIRQGGKLREKGVDALFRKHAKYLAYQLKSEKLNVADKEDILQETFIKLVRHCDSYKGDSSIRTWITSIAINCMKDHLRSVKSRSTTVADKAADQINKGAIAFEHTAVMRAGESRVEGGVKVTELPYAGKSEEKSHRTSSPPMFISMDNDWEDDEGDGLASLEGQHNSLWNYDPAPEAGLFENCIDQGYAEFAKRFSEQWYALSLVYDGYDTTYIATAIQRTPGATREFLSQTRKRIKEFLLPCEEYL